MNKLYLHLHTKLLIEILCYFIFIFFRWGGKMAKSFKDVVQYSPGTGLGTPVKTKKPLSWINTPPAEPPFGFKLHRPTTALHLIPLNSTPAYICVHPSGGSKIPKGIRRKESAYTPSLDMYIKQDRVYCNKRKCRSLSENIGAGTQKLMISMHFIF